MIYYIISWPLVFYFVKWSHMHISSVLIPIANGVIYHHTMAKIRDAKWYEELMFYSKNTHIEYWLLNTFRMWKEKQVWGCVSKSNGNI